MLGKIEGKRRQGQQRMRWLVSINDSVDMNLSKLWEIVKDRGAWHATVHGVAKGQTLATATTTIHHFSIIIMQIFVCVCVCVFRMDLL